MAVVISNSMAVGRLNAGRLRPKNPSEILSPEIIESLEAAGIDAASLIQSIQAAQIDGANEIQAVAASEIDEANELIAVSPEQILAPEQISALSAANIDAVNVINAVSAATLDAPNALSAEQAPNIAAPNTLTSIPDNLEPPFPLNHARILYDNLLADSDTTSAGRLTLSPNTYERAISSGAGSITYTMPQNRNIDCVAIGAGSWVGVEAQIQTSNTVGGSFVTRATVTPDNNRPIIAIFNSVSVRRVRVIFAGVVTVGVVSAGIALQMQRPIFGGHNPITMSRQTEYQSRRSESGNFVSRNIIREGLNGQYEWSNLTDNWVRQYFDPFILSARKLPFFIAWRPEDYPDEVAYAWTTGDISPNNIGTRNLMSVSMDVQAYGD
ncbi:hypothetical protein N22_023 [Idiomarinaceae phage 1N2-2]|uniref:hypothetical protein n=1 Tax=Idiomarinaceae phage 1N2-2 TaxID=1536592 RepID=UPI0004F8DE60|nr:hypothetical protein N22_023 [Idiomarinaceae phage 1N2-2]AIM40725.1 hypothetical protein N22_023 [Idiomarinaceae phage 1N2-2]